MQILGQKLYSEQELIREVNKEVKTTNALNGKMLVYYRDVMGMVPKPIRIRATEKPSGAHSFYTQYALDSTKLIAKENKLFRKNLKDIMKEHGSMLEENKIKSDILRQKFDFYIQTKHGISYAIEVKSTSKEKEPEGITTLDWAIVTRAAGLIDAIKEKRPEEEVDKLLDDLQTFYQKRTRQRVAQQIEKEEKE
jgi:hypothetical protein